MGSDAVEGVYQGISEAGDPYFTVEGQYYFGSSTEYTNGANNAPAYTAETFCFLTGTLVATPAGLVAVEDLAIGDLVLTSDGRTVPVKWMGRQAFMPAFGMPEARRPVIIVAGALGENLPARDLRVTSDHALLLDGTLVQAGALVNGTTIRRMTAAELGERFVVYHIELENHELVVAEGVAAETFVDNVSRRHFDNYAEFEALFGTSPASIAEIDLPRVKSARQLPASIRARVQDAAERLVPAQGVAA
ncbi:Hint domain-containing protein [Ancylobacter sonchi]|uniref:Hint domain-containing protein n=1 Tax=Ancylobacter sonchi TaxID=1937790 RepID=UPI001BD2B8AF|nr:Hint domain-containing protein [Ancylobacter sonchi]MBS7532536.1 Hint domain-containing protein [Ancylobacter sonchi]